MESQRKTVLITGASGGIGLELAKLFAKDGYNLILVARSGQELEKIVSAIERKFATSGRFIVLDLEAPDAAQKLFEQLQQEGVEVDVLVNNAGFGKHGEFATIPLPQSLGQIQLNINALTALTRLFLEPMIARRRGKIMNVASTAGFQPGPQMAVYYATKAYVISFSEALADEVRDLGITVTCLCPGVTATGFQERAGVKDTFLFKILPPMTAESVARKGYRALQSNRVIFIPGFRNWLIAQAPRFSPRRLVTAVSGMVLKNVRARSASGSGS